MELESAAAAKDDSQSSEEGRVVMIVDTSEAYSSDNLVARDRNSNNSEQASN